MSHVYLGWVSTELYEVLVQQSILNRFELIWHCYDLEMTLPRPWDNSPMKSTTNLCHHVYLYMTHSYTTLRVKGTILRWPLVTLSMHRKSADLLKVTWHIVRLKKYGLQKYPRGGGRGFRLSAYGLQALAFPLSSSSTTSHELLSQFSTCSGCRWLGKARGWCGDLCWDQPISPSQRCYMHDSSSTRGKPFGHHCSYIRNAGLMLGRRRTWWHNINLALGNNVERNICRNLFHVYPLLWYLNNANIYHDISKLNKGIKEGELWRARMWTHMGLSKQWQAELCHILFKSVWTSWSPLFETSWNKPGGSVWKY